MNASPPRFGTAALALCRLAARALGWRPNEFWSATPQELACLLEPEAGAPCDGLDRATLNAMMEHDHER